MTFLRRRPLRERMNGTPTAKQRAGDAAELAACEHLERAGCRIVARNVRYREGELDIVADDRGTLVFAEVRARNDERFGGALASIDEFKRRRLVRAAQHYLQQRFGERSAQRGALPQCRFDVVTADESGVTEWIRDAFAADE